ncbi:hypothetical protein LIER_12559 [Lithospermum erythrorhizon]|uniref:NAC domain-containing protein n=1 Tax=Lithospermum erythrorhizon TaxID=34254 RepID=A0AAV3PU69_LITER
MDERRAGGENKIDDVMLPGFRFHPTDEELVGFYLRRKIQQRYLPIELIKQIDIYKYDPWDLPKLAATGEKEWYFYCPRDRKYKNSARPNRVTGAGFWKATGTDRPIYSSDGAKCIGLKKSLVFYRGRAAKGFKTDWMMHEFRLPSMSSSCHPAKPLEKISAPADSWAICRIFKKPSSTTHRAFSQNWMAPVQETGSPDMFTQSAAYDQFHSENISCTNESVSTMGFPTLNIPSNLVFSSPEIHETSKCTFDIDSILFDSTTCSVAEQQMNNFSISSSQEMQGSIIIDRNDPAFENNQSNAVHPHVNDQWEIIRSIGFPFSLSSEDAPVSLKPTSPWDSPPCPSPNSTTFSTNKCYMH